MKLRNKLFKRSRKVRYGYNVNMYKKQRNVVNFIVQKVKQLYKVKIVLDFGGNSVNQNCEIKIVIFPLLWEKSDNTYAVDEVTKASLLNDFFRHRIDVD